MVSILGRDMEAALNTTAIVLEAIVIEMTSMIAAVLKK